MKSSSRVKLVLRIVILLSALLLTVLSLLTGQYQLYTPLLFTICSACTGL